MAVTSTEPGGFVVLCQEALECSTGSASGLKSLIRIDHSLKSHSHTGEIKDRTRDHWNQGE